MDTNDDLTSFFSTISKCPNCGMSCIDRCYSCAGHILYYGVESIRFINLHADISIRTLDHQPKIVTSKKQISKKYNFHVSK